MSSRARTAGWLRVVGLALALLAPDVARAQDTWTTPHPGLRVLDRRAAGPRRIFAAVVDLCADGVSMRASSEAEHGTTTSRFARGAGVQAAVNGDFFNLTTRIPSNAAAHDGVSWAGRDGTGSGFVAFGVDLARLSRPSEVVDPLEPWMREVVSGHPMILTAGEPATDSGSFCTTRHPRTMVGFSEDRRRLILAVVDGRSTSSIGMRCSEEGALMRELGAFDALNLDGGGSTTMWIEGRGVVNAPSDGSERSDGNHLGVFARGSGPPGSCLPLPVEEAALLSPVVQGAASSDLDGDGRADLCVRAAAGVRCALATPTGFGAPFDGPPLSDDAGWADPTNFATIALADVTGDGRDDLCARGDAGLFCWPSRGDGFAATPIDGPAWSDANGWDAPRYHASIAYADLDADGRLDVCGRAAAGLVCQRSTGEGFVPFGAPLDAFSDAAGFADGARWASVRLGDLDGDGRADVCGRAEGGVRCFLAGASGFESTTVEGPPWRDVDGWTDPVREASIRLVDLDGDGHADLCGLGRAGFVCRRFDGAGFGDAITVTDLAATNGWDDLANAETVRLGDVDADGDLDLCARADAGMFCWPYEDGAFGAHVEGPAWSDEAGFWRARYARTVRLADLDGDGDADLCVRAAAGVRCHRAEGGLTFGPAVEGPAWSDEAGFWAERYHATFRFGGPSARPAGPGLPDAGAPTSDVDAGPPVRPHAVWSDACAARPSRGERPGFALVALALALLTLTRRR